MKKNFKNTNAAAAFITEPKQPETSKPTAAAKKPQPQPQPEPEEEEVTYFRQPPRAKDGEERRTRRISIVCKPSVARLAAQIAYKRGISISYLFEKLVEGAK